MKIVLTIWLLVNGEIIEGKDVDGYAPREQPSIEVCEERVRRSSFFTPPKGVDQIFMECVKID